MDVIVQTPEGSLLVWNTADNRVVIPPTSDQEVIDYFANKAKSATRAATWRLVKAIREDTHTPSVTYDSIKRHIPVQKEEVSHGKADEKAVKQAVQGTSQNGDGFSVDEIGC